MRLNHGVLWLAATIAGASAGIAVGHAIASSVL